MTNKACNCGELKGNDCQLLKDLKDWILKKKKFLLKQNVVFKESGTIEAETSCSRGFTGGNAGNNSNLIEANSFETKENISSNEIEEQYRQKKLVRKTKLDLWSLSEYVMFNQECLGCRRCVYRILNENPMLYKMLSNDWFCDVHFMRWVCSKYGNALSIAHLNVKNDYRAVFNATKIDAMSLGFAAQRFKENPKFIILAGRGNPSALMYVSGKALGVMLDRYVSYKNQILSTGYGNLRNKVSANFNNGALLGGTGASGQGGGAGNSGGINNSMNSPIGKWKTGVNFGGSALCNTIFWKDKEFIEIYIKELEAMEEKRIIKNFLSISVDKKSGKDESGDESAHGSKRL